MRDFAWRQIHIEHGLAIPTGGRREEWNGQRLTLKQPCGDIRICWSAINNPANFIDENGHQYSQSCQPRRPAGAEIHIDLRHVTRASHKTLFADLWHFQDPLHERLGRVLAYRIWAQHHF
ncbi:MAG: hypothetical protein VKO44_02800 [Cyanobacteriota bacterium]|nr:hypothetical protein [Cyanobacteriota bacterium]